MSNILVEQKFTCICKAGITVVLSILWSDLLYSYAAVVFLICMNLHLCCIQFVYYRWWCIWWTTLVTFPWELELPAYHLWLWNMMMCLASQQMSWVLKFFLLQIYRLGQGWWVNCCCKCWVWHQLRLAPVTTGFASELCFKIFLKPRYYFGAWGGVVVKALRY